MTPSFLRENCSIGLVLLKDRCFGEEQRRERPPKSDWSFWFSASERCEVCGRRHPRVKTTKLEDLQRAQRRQAHKADDLPSPKTREAPREQMICSRGTRAERGFGSVVCADGYDVRVWVRWVRVRENRGDCPSERQERQTTGPQR